MTLSSSSSPESLIFESLVCESSVIVFATSYFLECLFESEFLPLELSFSELLVLDSFSSDSLASEFLSDFSELESTSWETFESDNLLSDFVELESLLLSSSSSKSSDFESSESLSLGFLESEIWEVFESLEADSLESDSFASESSPSGFFEIDLSSVDSFKSESLLESFDSLESVASSSFDALDFE